MAEVVNGIATTEEVALQGVEETAALCVLDRAVAQMSSDVKLMPFVDEMDKEK